MKKSNLSQSGKKANNGDCLYKNRSPSLNDFNNNEKNLHDLLNDLKGQNKII